MAYDTRYPDNKASVTLQINVNRNVNRPVFDQNAYTFEIDETRLAGSIFGVVRATDRDVLVS